MRMMIDILQDKDVFVRIMIDIQDKGVFVRIMIDIQDMGMFVHTQLLSAPILRIR